MIVSKPGGTGLAKTQLEFVRVSSKKVEILMDRLRMAETGMQKENEWDPFYIFSV